MTRLPTILVSHGAPTLAIHDGESHRFLKGWGRSLGKPAAILVLSAHYDTDRATVTTAETPETIYDFRGFPDELYDTAYPAPGSVALARRVADLLHSAGIGAREDEARGLDHGAWVPLMLMYPDADVPVVQLSIASARGADYHLRLGRALATLADEDVLVVGSGSAAHNLGLVLSPDRPEEPPPWTVEFNEWLADALRAGAVDDLVDYRAKGPHARENHPTEEHYFPLLAALGAAGPDATGERVHTSYTYGALSMDAYEFRPNGRRAS